MKFIKVGEIASVGGGKRVPKGHIIVDYETSHPYLRVTDFTEIGLDTTNLKYISEETYRKIHRYTISDKDVYLSIAGTIGRVGMIPKYLSGANLTENAAKIVINNTEYDALFLTLYLQSVYGQAQIMTRIGGTSQPKLPLYRIKEIKIPDIGIDDQRNIAAKIELINNLLEMNSKKINLMEKLIDNFYREWFVRMRFSGYEKCKFTDGLPEGWRKGVLSDIANVVMGQSPESKYYNEIGEGLPFHQGVTDFGDRYPVNTTYCITSNRLANEGDILCSVRAPVGRLNISLEKIIIGRGLSAIRSKLRHQSFLFYLLKNHFFKEDMFGSGAVFAAIKKYDLESQKIVIPSDETVKEFETVSIPIDEQIKNLTSHNRLLVKLRDMLLPKLMSGVLQV